MQRISWLQAYGKDFIEEKITLRNVKRCTSEVGVISYKRFPYTILI